MVISDYPFFLCNLFFTDNNNNNDDDDNVDDDANGQTPDPICKVLSQLLPSPYACTMLFFPFLPFSIVHIFPDY